MSSTNPTVIKPTAQRPQSSNPQQSPYNQQQYASQPQQSYNQYSQPPSQYSQPLQYQPSIYQQQYEQQQSPYMYQQYNQPHHQPAYYQPPYQAPLPQPQPTVSAPLPHKAQPSNTIPQSTQPPSGQQPASVNKPVARLPPQNQTKQQSQASQQQSSKPTSSPTPATVSAPAQEQRHDDPPMQAPYIGCRISLISNANVRYEGILHGINPDAATVILSTVRCYGTESRTTSTHYVPSTNDIYSEITFAGKDIQELSVLENIVNTPSVSKQPIADPAIQSVGDVIKSDTVNEQSNNHNNDNNNDNIKSSNKPINAQRSSFARGPSDSTNNNNKSTGFMQRTSNKVRYINDTIEPIDQNFDFQASNARFDKSQIAAQIQQSIGITQPSPNNIQPVESSPDIRDIDNTQLVDRVAAVNLSSALPVAADKLPQPVVPTNDIIEVKYNKSKSFFDDISRDNTAERRNNKDRSNIDTFGNVARGYHRSGGSVRGRGGRSNNQHGDRNNSHDDKRGGVNSTANYQREWRTTKDQ